MNKENYFIKQFKNNNIIGDDGAVITCNNKTSLVYSVDAFFENVHFKKKWLSLKQIAIKSMLVNISDAIVMNAVPKYALLSIAMPKNFTKKQLKKLSSGFNKIAKQYKIKIIGGDTISNEKLDISITIISQTKNPIYRNNIKIGNLMCYTGNLGTVSRDLKKLQKNKKITKKSKFIKPILHPKFFYEISPYISGAIDISDGLGSELKILSKINKIDFELFDKISKKILCSGEEYEILFAFNKNNLTKIQEIAKKHNIVLNIFAKVVNGNYTNKCKEHHF